MKPTKKDLLYALEMQIDWRMRDETPCACPAGKNEDGKDSKGVMPTHHSTACEALRKVLIPLEL